MPEWDDRALFEKLILDGFQAGLSWITILRKRDAFRTAFDGFEPEKIVRYDAAKVDALMADPGIVRNRAKIEATIGAGAHLSRSASAAAASRAISGASSTASRSQNARRDDARHPGRRPQVPRRSPRTCAQRGGNFVGPTIVYAFMQAVGMVNDHLVDCHRHAACAALGRKPPW